MRKVITAPSVEPLTLAEAKIYLKVDDSTEDALITSLIVAARQMAENHMGRSLVKTVWESSFDEFPDTDEDSTFELYPCPVSAINTVKYYDSNNTLQTLASTVYQTDYISEPSRLSLKPGQSWPDVADRTNAVVINYDAGYGTTAAMVPDLIKAGLYLLIGHLYENRQNVVKETVNELPIGSRSLFDMYRVY